MGVWSRDVALRKMFQEHTLLIHRKRHYFFQETSFLSIKIKIYKPSPYFVILLMDLD